MQIASQYILKGFDAKSMINLKMALHSFSPTTCGSKNKSWPNKSLLLNKEVLLLLFVVILFNKR